MDAILRQIGELLVNSIPTIISVLILWTAYTFLVHNKLRQVLEQRHALTEGAIERAQQEIAIAEKRTAEYEQRVREARSQIYKTQQANRLRVMEERNAALAESRKNAGEMVKKARAVAGERYCRRQSGAGTAGQCAGRPGDRNSFETGCGGRGPVEMKRLSQRVWMYAGSWCGWVIAIVPVGTLRAQENAKPASVRAHGQAQAGEAFTQTRR